MESLRLHGDWDIIKIKLTQRWPALTDDDLIYFPGQESELIEKIRLRVGESRSGIELAIHECRLSTKWPTS